MRRHHSGTGRERPWALIVGGLISGVLGAALPACESSQEPEADTRTSALDLVALRDGTHVIPNWRLQSSASLDVDGDVLSAPRFDDRGWLTVPARSTVMAGLIVNGRYPDPNFSTNLRDSVDPADFKVPWWYRQEFVVAPTAPGGRRRVHTFLRFAGGVISRGELWVNGTKLSGVAGTDDLAGAYPKYEFDISHLLRPGRNAIAIKAMPADPFRDLTVSFLDWSPLAPDNNMGIWRDVTIVRTGAVSVANPRALPELELPGLGRASLTLKAEVSNHGDTAIETTVAGVVTGGDRPIRIQQRTALGPHETKTVTFAAGDFAALRLEHPRIWWPAQFGEQPLYDLAMTVSNDHEVTDRATTQFGIRDVRSELTPQGYRRFLVNGKPFGVRGGGWASDLFLRPQPERLADELRYARDLGLNTIRMEGKEEDHELLELADRLGIMLLPGWECCTKWEKYSTWTEQDYRVAGASTLAEAQRMVNHPSVLGFFIGSDNAATARVEQTYIDALHAADFQAPIIPSAAAKSTPQLGASGMKMDGPYWWIPPNYWYEDKLGGAYGFASEVGSGPTIPELDSLKRFLTPTEIEDLWSKPNQAHYHLAKKEVFSKLAVFSTAMANRYGAPKDQADFLRKAQLSNYEANRAQFEAFGRDFSDAANPATGVIYWMLNNAWPTLYWHLWDHNLATAGSYFGAKKALRPLHVQYSYDDRSIVVVNTGLAAKDGLTVRATAFGMDGSVLSDERASAAAEANAAKRVLTLPAPSGTTGTYLVRLLLTDGSGREIDRNVYWLSTKADVLDYPQSTWWYTPTVSYADLTGLEGLAPATVASSSKTFATGEGLATEVTLRNTSQVVALALRASLRQGRGGAEVVPVRWSDNYVTLWPGESITLRADYRPGDLAGNIPHVQVSGFNVSP
ncbi:hypothetical protein LVJ94_19985 [Pendulispora rubella]|uniref:Exo-1,4-beta-D-glucosaminidase n=1 Tax=Pendulispora rubella TaxID=2741070 RepID=A0ABZ2LEX3_9BACT